MSKHIYYVEVDFDDNVLVKVPICEYEKGKDYIESLIFEHEGKQVDYYQDIAGDFDKVDAFLEQGHLIKYDEYFLEKWKTDLLGYYDDRYIGLMISGEAEDNGVVHCPLCDYPLRYECIKGVHTYKCDECPFIGIEYIDGDEFGILDKEEF